MHTHSIVFAPSCLPGKPLGLADNPCYS